MKRLRVERWGGSLLPPRNPRLQCPFTNRAADACGQRIRPQTSRCIASIPQQRHISTSARKQAVAEEFDGFETEDTPRKSRSRPQPSPIPSSRPPTSAKLAALHARLSLPARFPLQTLARCLIHPSADSRPEFNNASLAILGNELLGYYTSEWLLCNYPRLPMPVLFAAQYAYVGPKTLAHMRLEWGVEAAAAPGEEVDRGLLQFKKKEAGNAMAADMMSRRKDLEGIPSKSGTGRSNESWNYRRGMSSRIVYDDQYGDLQSGVHELPPNIRSERAESANGETLIEDEAKTTAPAGSNPFASADQEAVDVENASAAFIRAVYGALYLHTGVVPTQNFHKNHILSRHLPLHTLFQFKHPTRDLSRLCAREGFESPVARLISETGRLSRTPVFVVGVYSGDEKLGEDAGSSLDEARIRAAAAALRSWYLYSPPKEEVCLPSSTEVAGSDKGAKRWKPQMIDIGEIVT